MCTPKNGVWRKKISHSHVNLANNYYIHSTVDNVPKAVSLVYVWCVYVFIFILYQSSNQRQTLVRKNSFLFFFFFFNLKSAEINMHYK